MSKIKILVVEDESIVAKDIQNSLKHLGYDVPFTISNGVDALKKAHEIKPDLILMDIVLKGQMDGIEAAEKIKNELNIPVIYLTAYEDSKTLQRAKLTEPLGYILKPFDERDLHTTLEMAMYKHKMEMRLKESEEKYRKLVELSPDGIGIHSDEKFIFANKTGALLFGYENPSDLYGKSIFDFRPADKHDLVREKNAYVLNNNRPLPFVEDTFLRADGTEFPVEVAAIPFTFENKKAIQVIYRDITQRKKAEEDLKKAYSDLKETQNILIQAEKLSALGRFSAGIAHEIRNPLANISASAQFCITKYDIDEKMKKHFDVILRNTETANRIIKELLDFTSPREIQFKYGNVDKVIEHISNLIGTRCEKQNVKLDVKIPQGIPQIMINEKKLEEAMLNFVSNSIEAMPDGGNLSISANTNNVNQLTIKITDSGSGILEENKDKIFEPFFTTKDYGTGLGMSLAYQIIKSHSGELDIESEAGKGTVIRIKLPVINFSSNHNHN